MNKCFVGDCRAVMRKLIAEGVRVQMCVTSPPYWGLRDYGTAQWEGGDAECDHVRADWSKISSGQTQNSCRPGRTAIPSPQYGRDCGICGARRIDQQLGLEESPQAYVANMVEVFSLVRELLADDGVLFLNLGDSYAGSGKGAWDNKDGGQKEVYIPDRDSPQTLIPKVPDGLKPKDLVGIPWRVAFALQADGWYLRQDIIWAKPNPMPESVTDRCTKAHEYLFLLAKRERYYYDAAAIAEPSAYPGDNRAERTDTRKEVDPFCIDNGSRARTGNPTGETRNRRSVWTVPTAPYAEAHFATFPPALIEPCIMAGSRVGDVVLDPFMGSGTTGQVAQDLGRRWIGIELNEAYAKLQDRRTAQQAMVF